MPLDDQERLRHMIAACRRAIDFTAGKTREDFIGDDKTVYAVISLLQIIGEAARHTTSSFQAAHPEVEWKGAVGLRNHLAHGYFDVDLVVIWDTVTERIPQMLRTLEPLVEQGDFGFS